MITQKQLDAIHKDYCVAAARAELHIGEEAEERLWAATDAVWMRYLEAKARQDDYDQTVDQASSRWQ